MTLVKSGFHVTPIQQTTKEGVRVISAMSTPRIVMYVMNRHRVGLLMLSTVFMAGYIVYDKVVRIFV
jgi:hypothetical protein